MAKLLLSGAEVLLLDEPTNHLDIQSVEWLEGYLLSYPGALLIISHDRYFLDRVTTGTLEMENGHLRSFTGNYSAYLQHKARERGSEPGTTPTRKGDRAHGGDDRAVPPLESGAQHPRGGEQGKAAGKAARRQCARKTRRPPFAFSWRRATPAGRTSHRRTPRKALRQAALRDVNLHIRRGSARFCWPQRLRQDHAVSDSIGQIAAGCGHGAAGFADPPRLLRSAPEQPAHGEHAARGNLQRSPALNQTQARSALAAFLFRGEDVFKPIASLSGGEQARSNCSS